MNSLAAQQDLINRVCRLEQKATVKLYRVFHRSLKLHLFQKGYTSRDLLDDLLIRSMVELYNKKTPPILEVQAHSYMLGIAKKLLTNSLTKSEEIPFPNSRFDQLPAEDDLIEDMEIAQSKKLLNRLISNISFRCRELLERYLLGEAPEKICTGMNYSSMSMLYKKKSQCIEKLKSLGRESSECCEYFNFE